MPLHVDSPAPGEFFDPADFRVRGWLWLPEEQPRIAAIEVRDEETGTLLGTCDCAELVERPEVNTALRLAPGTTTGFNISARHAAARPGAPLKLGIHVRTSSGASAGPKHVHPLTIPAREQHPLQMLLARLSPAALGLEIGAHVNPLAGTSPFYTDIVADFAGTAGKLDFLSDARALPLPDDTLDYLISSHVLEHLANPLAALHEWQRVLRPGGLLYLVVPDRRFTFDQPRVTTTPEHLLRDFNMGISAADVLTHVDEFVFQTDWARLNPAVPAAKRADTQTRVRAAYRHDLQHGRPIDIHYHTFTPESLDAALRAAGLLSDSSAAFAVLARAERYPPGRGDGIALLLEKNGRKPASASRASETASLPPARPPTPALPIVCPATLAPLHHAPEGTCFATTANTKYPVTHGIPILLPPPGTVPTRPWRDHSWTIPLAPAEEAPRAITAISHLDEPASDSRVDPLCFQLRGWLHLGPHHAELAAVEAWSGGTQLGETAAFYERTDVNAAHHLAAGTRTGFELFAHHPEVAAGATFPISIRARLHDGSRSPVIFETRGETIARDYRTNHFGILLDQRTTAIQRHDNIFAVGPSQAAGSGVVADLLRRHLGRPPLRVIDVGCGLGSYGRGLLADGYDWLGVEVSTSDCAELARLGLPHRQVDGRTLPFPDASFDAALCLEVLEHIADPRSFLAEIQRVAPRRLIVSVPNCELLGYLWDYLATPWHMLEATHTNFFTRWSLGALLREFYPQVELSFHTPYPLRTVEGTPLHYHLFAVATTRP